MRRIATPSLIIASAASCATSLLNFQQFPAWARSERRDCCVTSDQFTKSARRALKNWRRLLGEKLQPRSSSTLRGNAGWLKALAIRKKLKRPSFSDQTNTPDAETVMKLNRLFIAGMVLVLLASSRAFACECAGTRPTCQEYWEAKAVFSGTVIESRRVTVNEGTYSHEMRAVRLSIDQAFRGIEDAEVEVLTGFGGGDCGFGFRQTEQYLVYAYRSERDQKLYTSICSRTRLLADAKADLAYIRGLAKAQPGGTISGDVVKYLRDANGTLANQPL